jgi:hypothetical protein
MIAIRAENTCENDGENDCACMMERAKMPLENTIKKINLFSTELKALSTQYFDDFKFKNIS